MDFAITHHGTISILTALTPAAIEWADAHLPEDRQLWGRNGSVIEPRYLADIIDGICAEGLSFGP